MFRSKYYMGVYIYHGTNTCFNVVWVFGDVKNVLEMIGVRIGEIGKNLEIFILDTGMGFY